MRCIAAVVFSLAMACAANASSILVLGDTQSADPSIVRLDPGPAKDPSIVTAGAAAQDASSPSVIEFGEPTVSDDKVAAIPAGRHARPGGVVVIRAGVVGGSSAEPVATAAAAATGDSTAAATKSSNGTLRDAMTQAGQAPALAQ